MLGAERTKKFNCILNVLGVRENLPTKLYERGLYQRRAPTAPNASRSEYTSIRADSIRMKNQI